MRVAQNVFDPVIELFLRCRLFVKVPCTVFRSVDIAGLKGVEAMNSNEKLTRKGKKI